MSPARVPVSLLCGLDSGDRAALVTHWLGSRPDGERWAVLAQGGIAFTAAQGDGDHDASGGRGAASGAPTAAGADGREAVLVQAIGGCPCCSAATVLRLTLVRLLRQRRWDRILVATGPGAQPPSLLRLLREPALAAVVAPAEVVVGLDLRQSGQGLDPRAPLPEPVRAQLAVASLALLVGDDRAAFAAIRRQAPQACKVLDCEPGAWPDWAAVRLPAAP